MIERLRRFVTFLALGLWLGGLTFYSALVVPAGTEVIGRTEQGFVTRLVTLKLNWIGVGVLVVLLWNVVTSRRPMLFATWLMLAAVQIFLMVHHARLDALLDIESHEVLDSAAFYASHRIYLIATTVQWLAGMWHAWLLAAAPRDAAEGNR